MIALRVRRIAATHLAMLVRREGEPLSALLDRLDKAIARAWELEEFTDEVNH